MPRGKQRAAWLDKDTLLIGRDWGAGTMSEAGYPITVREWKRGEPCPFCDDVVEFRVRQAISLSLLRRTQADQFGERHFKR